MHRQSSESSVVAQEPSSCYEKAFTDHYCVLKNIGEGSFGQVVLARHRLTGLEVAVKVLSKTVEKEAVLAERNWLIDLEHPYVIQLFQVIETDQNMYLIMEHASGGQLRRYIPHAGGLPEDQVRSVFREMVHVVHYCHEKGVAHLDLKPENFVLDVKGHLKLIDFGLSMSFTPGQKLTGFRGTLLYSAPEMVKGKGFEGPPADVWSLGVSLYFMLSGTRPFKMSTTEGLKKRILEVSYSIPPHVSEEASDLIQQILTLDPKQRPTLEQILRHPWLTQDEHFSPRLPTLSIPTSCHRPWSENGLRQLQNRGVPTGSGFSMRIPARSASRSPLPPLASDIRDFLLRHCPLPCPYAEMVLNKFLFFKLYIDVPMIYLKGKTGLKIAGGRKKVGRKNWGGLRGRTEAQQPSFPRPGLAFSRDSSHLS
uniref:non-specific serine/threonine protein kinase n=1 Tax=Urocitellus parryii TaxID=9999 RepID=A0A8D2I0N2_UROPR